jgi:asparagine N-glycosylation enzyme membrane subunit Stt3
MKKIYLLLREDSTIEGFSNFFENGTIEYDLEDSEYDYFVNNYYYNAKFLNNSIVYSQVFKEKENRRQEIRLIKEQRKILLQETDYQIIKCYEAFMRQQPLPYNLEELSSQRDAWRAEINQLEEELKQYEV